MADTTTVIKDPNDLPPVRRWETEITYAEKEVKKFWDRAQAANKRYIDERDVTDAEAKKFNIFYANTNILESALYSQVPKPFVSRRYTDYKDQVGRVAALVLKRALGQDLQDPIDLFDSTMRAAVQDRLVPGLGTAWLRLETDTSDIPESEGGQLTDATPSTIPSAAPFPTQSSEAEPTTLDPQPIGMDIPLKKIADQRVAVDYVYWQDFLWSPCRVWSERRWVARKVYMTRKQLTRRFGKEKADKCQLNFNTNATNMLRTPDGTTPKNEALQKAIVYEIWDRDEREVVWYSQGCDVLLDKKADFLKLSGFEPCPTPMFANVTTSNSVPRPDFFMIQDQYSELDTVNARISLLVSACKVVGIYASNATGIIELFQGAENKMIPVDNWAMFAEKGGVKGNVDWLPLEQIVTALQRLSEARESIKGQIYELTGIADIVRGASKASETLGAQQIKAQFASVRIKKLQDEVARFASDILRIKAEIMVRHFSPEILIRKSGITRTDNDQYVPAAIAMIKSEEGFNWRVTIQADSMAQADYANEKKDRIEFMSAVSGYMGNALPMTLQIPETKPIILGVLRWGLSAFKEADDIEGLLDKQLAEMEGKPPPPPPQDPKMAAVQAQIEGNKQKQQMDMQKQQADLQADREKNGMEQQMMQMKMSFEQAMNQMKMEMEKFKLMMEQRKGQVDIEQKQVEGQLSMQQSVQDHALQTEQAQQSHELTMQTQEAAAAQTLEQTKAAGSQKLQQGEQEGRQKLTLAKKAAAQKPKGETK